MKRPEIIYLTKRINLTKLYVAQNNIFPLKGFRKRVLQQRSDPLSENYFRSEIEAKYSTILDENNSKSGNKMFCEINKKHLISGFK